MESVAEQATAGDVLICFPLWQAARSRYPSPRMVSSSVPAKNDTGQTGTVTTNGGKLNVRTGAGMDYTAFAQLPNGTMVRVIGKDGDWLKVVLPEKVGYVYSGYMTVSDGEAGSGKALFSGCGNTGKSAGYAGRRSEWRCRP